MSASAIVPAYNEAPRIGRVLDVLVSFQGFSEIIVVDDSSTDGTAAVARGRGVRVIRHEQNLGKGTAMESGVAAARGSALFFCDADILGLTHGIIAEVLAPVTRGEKEMFIAARREKERAWGPFSYSPLLDGQRALTRELWERIPARYKRGFAIESALNHYAYSFGYSLYDITQTKKEEKCGYVAGTLARLEMYRQIVLTKTALYA